MEKIRISMYKTLLISVIHLDTLNIYFECLMFYRYMDIHEIYLVKINLSSVNTFWKIFFQL